MRSVLISRATVVESDQDALCSSICQRMQGQYPAVKSLKGKQLHQLAQAGLPYVQLSF
jgi:hypothetical protein